MPGEQSVLNMSAYIHIVYPLPFFRAKAAGFKPLSNSDLKKNKV